MNQSIISGKLARDPELRFNTETREAKVKLTVITREWVRGRDGKWHAEERMVSVYLSGLYAEAVAGYNKQGQYVEILATYRELQPGVGRLIGQRVDGIPTPKASAEGSERYAE